MKRFGLLVVKRSCHSLSLSLQVVIMDANAGVSGDLLQRLLTRMDHLECSLLRRSNESVQEVEQVTRRVTRRSCQVEKHNRFHAEGTLVRARKHIDHRHSCEGPTPISSGNEPQRAWVNARAGATACSGPSSEAPAASDSSDAVRHFSRQSARSVQ